MAQAMKTLASLKEEQSGAGDQSNAKTRDRKHSQQVKKAMVLACSLSHEADKFDLPNALLPLGNLHLISHALHSLHSAGITEAVVVTGYQEQLVIAAIEGDRANLPELATLKVEFVQLGEGWRGGQAASILKARDHFSGDGEFLLCPCDAIFDASLIALMAGKSLEGGDDARLLVETDLDGMVGLPRHVMTVALRPLHSADRIYQIGTNLSVYSGVFTGLMRCRLSLFEKLQEMLQVFSYVSLADVLQSFASQGSLVLQSTQNLTWFTVQSDASAAFTEQSLARLGHSHTLSDGRTISLIGMPRKTRISPSTGGDWSEFSVESWRSAVYTCESYFSQLFEDTVAFVQEICDTLGGRDRAMVVEIGCGTGEALEPFFPKAAYCVGVDINPKFIEFCRGNVAPEHADTVAHVVGDAQQLSDLLSSAPGVGPWLTNTEKVVMCVGNTIGIMPDSIKRNIYMAMADLAGPTGVAVVVYWNGNCFGDAVQNFYFKNPQLCGEFTGECIDLSTCTLTTPSGYRTHWTTPTEAQSIMDGLGMQVLKLVEKGKGVLVAFRHAPAAPAGPESGLEAQPAKRHKAKP